MASSSPISLPSLVSHLSINENSTRRILHPDNWRRVYLDALRISFRQCRLSTFLSLVDDDEHDILAARDCPSTFINSENLDFLYATLRNPSSFCYRDFPMYLPSGEINRFASDLCTIASGPRPPYQYLDDLIDFIFTQVHDYARYGVQVIGYNHWGYTGDCWTLPMDFGDEKTSITIEPKAMVRVAATRKAQETTPRALPPPILMLLDLHPEVARRHSSQATVSAYLLSVAQAHLRYHTTSTVATPCLIAIRYRMYPGTKTPIYVIYTARITRSYLDLVCAHQNVTETATMYSSPEYDTTDKAQMIDFAEALLQLCPHLVGKAVRKCGGENAVLARAAATQDTRIDELWQAEEERLRLREEEEEQRKKREWQRAKKRKRAQGMGQRKKVKTEVPGTVSVH
jgi:hypothetical protein